LSGGAVTAVSVPEPRDLVDHARRGAGHGLRCPAPRSSSRRLAVAVRLQHQDYPLLFASHAARAASLAATASRQPGSAARPSYQRAISVKRARGSPKRAALGTKAPMEKSAMV